MAHQLPKMFCRRLWQPSTPLQRLSTPVIRSFRHQPSKPVARRSYATGGTGPNPQPGKNPLPILPFIAIIFGGSAAYMLMLGSRAEMPPPNKPQISAPKKSKPVFSPSDVTVIFVLGGPGAGKGTQCANLVRDYGFTHLSAGDLLRAEQDRPESEFGQLIKDYIKDGKIVPMEVTVQLLENAITEVVEKDVRHEGKFLIDGFPRQMDQAIKFEDEVCRSRFVLFFDCPEDEMQKRLLERGKTSGRTDDNAESIKKRFKTFEETSMPVVDYFEKQGRVVKVQATKGPEEVYKETRAKVEEKLGKDL